MTEFDRSNHAYKSAEFDKTIQDIIDFFNQTQVCQLPIENRFNGTGVYAIYCRSKSGIYARFGSINRDTFSIPIYVGKAVPKGWRQARKSSSDQSTSYELYNRIREHGRSISVGEGLDLSDYHCRFIILEGKESDLIGTVEAALIRSYQPIWNTLIDGFGNHDPGKGRYQQGKSDWDVCHPGRPWAEKCQGSHADPDYLYNQIEQFLQNID